jgi:hypothetical protein
VGPVELLAHLMCEPVKRGHAESRGPVPWAGRWVVKVGLDLGLIVRLFFFIIIVLLFICAYKAWVISPPCPLIVRLKEFSP